MKLYQGRTLQIRAMMAAVFIGLLALLSAAPASALGLKIAPLEYKTILKANEVQKGFIDVSNPSGQAVNVRVTVQGFKQINNDGGLQFFSDERLSAAIQPDLTNFSLGPREALRMFFTVNGATLPPSDIYAAIFFTTDPSTPTNGVGQLVRVGTLLSIVNRTPGPRQAEITGISVPFVQLSDTISGSYRVKNTGPAQTGFYPDVHISAWPGGDAKKQTSSLVFGGHERSNDFRYSTGFGIHLVSVAYGDSVHRQWVITLAPWMVVTMLLIVVVAGTELLLLKRRRNDRKKTAKKSHEKASKKTASKPVSTSEK